MYLGSYINYQLKTLVENLNLVKRYPLCLQLHRYVVKDQRRIRMIDTKFSILVMRRQRSTKHVIGRLQWFLWCQVVDVHRLSLYLLCILCLKYLE